MFSIMIIATIQNLCEELQETKIWPLRWNEAFCTTSKGNGILTIL